MTRILPKALAAIAAAFKSRLPVSPLARWTTGKVAPALPVETSRRASGLPLKGAPETSLETLARLVRLTHLDGEPVQSMSLRCGHYARSKLFSLPEIARLVSDDGLSIGRCFIHADHRFALDQWQLVIFPMSGKAEIYEGFVE